jgi:hypothetical protein
MSYVVHELLNNQVGRRPGNERNYHQDAEWNGDAEDAHRVAASADAHGGAHERDEFAVRVTLNHRKFQRTTDTS